MRQVAMMNAGLASTAGAFGAAGAAGATFGNRLNGIRPDRFGARMQYLGRQLQYSFTFPIIAAGAAAMKWALDNEKAMTRVTKVYGDAAHGADFYAKEIKSLEKNFEALSNAFGVNQAEVINVAADWAAAGASGLALAKATELTLKTMVLGEMEAKEATKALIAIQAQYGLSTEQLTEAIAVLNMVENQTGASLKDLIDGFSRSAGVARSAGVDVRHLAAMMAALVPATGSAAQAGNALKTIFSRLISPTKEAKEVLGLMNINIDDMAWKGVNVTDRLMIMAKAFDGLSDSQQGVVASVVASRWQINKFEVLMRELLSDTGFYARALDATTDKQAVFNQMHRELNAVLTSNPRRLQIIWTMLQNAMADIIQPMIPLILALASAISSLVTWFSNLNPGVQKLVLILLGLLALVGPVIMFMGALKILVVELSMAFLSLGKPILWVISLLRSLIAINLITWAVTVVGTLNGLVMMIGPALAGLSAFIARWAITAGLGFFGLMVGVQRVFAFFLPAFLAMWYQFSTAVLALWRGLFTGITLIMTVGASLAGGIWRAMHIGMLAFSTAIFPSFIMLWRRLVVGIQTILIGFAAFAGGIFRTMYLGILTATVAFSRGAIALFTGFFTRIVPIIRAGAAAAAAAFSGPWGWAILAIVAVLAIFHKQIAQIWNNIIVFFQSNSKALAQAATPIAKIFIAIRDVIIKAFNSLPAGVRNALIAVVRIMHAAAMQIYKLMSYLNPFARHSPSLVENVQAGMAIIREEYASVAGAGQSFVQAGNDLEEFAQAVRVVQRAADSAEWVELRNNLLKLAPAAIASFDRLVAELNPLKDLLSQINIEMTRQQFIVDGLEAQLNIANKAFEEQENILQSLQDVAKGYEEQLDAAKQRLQDFANAPIKGMKDMADAIFENQMKQKELQLEMMKMEQVVGPLDKLQNKIEAINGQIELLRGEQTDLRQAGAGSDILSEYDQQIGLLQDQQRAIEDQVRPIQDLQDQLEELGRQGQMLDLENSLQFDPLRKQIDDLANSMEELTFDEIIAGVKDAKVDIDRYSASLQEANNAVTTQQAVVDQLKAARDSLQATYDVERDKLEAIKDQYDQVEERIRAIESAFRDVGSAAQKALGDAGGAMSPGAENFLGAAGGDFPEVGGAGGLGREGGLEDQSAAIDAFTKEIADKTKNMFGLFNFLEPVKKGWNAATKWLGETIGPSLSFVGDLFKSAFKGIGNPLGSIDWGKGLDVLETALKKVQGWLKMIWDLIGPELIKLWENLWPALKGAFSDIGVELAKFKDLIGPMMEATKNLWTILGPILGVVLALILLVVKAFISALAGGIGPFVTMIGEAIAAIIKIIRSMIEFVANVLSGNWKEAWDSFVNIFIGAWELVWAFLKGIVMTIVGLIVGLVTGIVDWFKWLFNILIGNSIIPDLVNGIINWFQKMWDFVNVLIQGVVNIFKWMWDNGVRPVLELFKQGMAFWRDAVKNAFDVATGIWQRFVDLVNWARGQINNAVEGVKGIINSIIGVAQNVWNNISNIFNSMVSLFNNLRNRFSFGGLFDGIISAFRNAINAVIGKWNSLQFGVGPFSVGTPNIPFMERGGVTSGMAIVGEGKRNFPEYVIPTDPAFRNRAVALFLSLAKSLGMGKSNDNALMASILAGAQRGMFGQRVEAFASGGILGAGGRVRSMRGGSVIIAPSTRINNYTFTGDLTFPNITSGDDAETFLNNLEALVNS